MNLKKFGRLVNASHVSLEHDYEVTGIELDTLAHTAWQQEGVLGARMTGADSVAAVLPLLLKIKLMNLLKTLGKFTLKQLVMRQLSTLLKSLVVHVSYLENN